MTRPSWLIGLLLLVVPLWAQSTDDLDYKRNSLATILVYHPEDEFGVNIHDAYLAMPLPDKYDDHNLIWRILDNSAVTGVKPDQNGLYKATYGHPLPNNEIAKNARYIEELLNTAQVGNALVAKWFGMDSTGRCNIDLILERGQYNASEVDVDVAMQTIRGMNILSDAGFELINHTFVLVNDITYVTAEQEAEAAKVSMAIIGGIFDAVVGGNSGRNMAAVTGAIADSFTGFNVKTHSYLFQLIWNDSIAQIFYDNYYTEQPDSAKLLAFVNDQTSFRIKYVAHEYEYDKKSTLKGQYDRAELVKTICARSVDKNIVALGKRYEEFKVKSPIYGRLTGKNGRIEGYTAKIGLKEGVTENSKWQVIQRIYNPDTHRTNYQYVATVQPVKGQIWDNRYNATLEKDEGSELHFTTFKKTAGGEIYPGMLLVEGRYSKP